MMRSSAASQTSNATRVWRFNPYDSITSMETTFTQHSYFPAAGERRRQLPEDRAACAYADLSGAVQFIPFPSKQCMSEAVAAHRKRIIKVVSVAHASTGGAKDEVPEIFFGQNRFDITSEEFEWVMNEVLGCDVFDTDIVKKKNTRCGKTLPSGGIRASVPSLHAWKTAVSLVNKRVMIDRTGVWYASTEQECAAMAAFCASIEGARVKNMPNKAITAEQPTGRKRN
jgi:hypothetical protein